MNNYELNLKIKRIKWKIADISKMIEIIESNQDVSLFNAKKALYVSLDTNNLKKEIILQLKEKKDQLESDLKNLK